MEVSSVGRTRDFGSRCREFESLTSSLGIKMVEKIIVWSLISSLAIIGFGLIFYGIACMIRDHKGE